MINYLRAKCHLFSGLIKQNKQKCKKVQLSLRQKIPNSYSSKTAPSTIENTNNKIFVQMVATFI